jgi:Concanavalin A-like lectin/glucanases superfamily
MTASIAGAWNSTEGATRVLLDRTWSVLRGLSRLAPVGVVVVALIVFALARDAAVAGAVGLSETTTAYPQAVLTDHPSSYYRFDESAGPIASDSSGNRHDGTYQSNVQFGVAGALPSESDPGISTTAPGDAVTESGADLPAANTPRTLEAWVNNVGGASGFDLLRYGDVAGGHGFEVQLAANASSISVTAGGTSVSAPTVGDFQHGWHLIDVTYDGSTTTIFEDGQIVGGGTLGSVGTVAPGQGLRAASNASGMGLDEAAVYPTALSATRIDAHWTAAQSTAQIASCAAVPTQPYPSAVLEDSPLMAFRLDELRSSPQGRVAIDYSSHCRNAAYHEHPSSVAGALTGDPDPALGASARDVALDQTGSGLPAGSAARTLEAWVSYQCCNGAFDLMRYGDVAGGHGFELQLADNASSISVMAGGTSVSASTVGDFQHGWHLVDVTYDGASVEIYQDGQIVGGGMLGATGTIAPGQGMRVASNAAGAGLDEIAVYDSALSPARINAHFHASTLSVGPGAASPSARISAPADRARFVKGQSVSASFTCTPGANGGALKPGTEGCAGTVANGSPIDTSSTGTHSFRVTATDTDAQSTTVISSYTVTAPLAPAILIHTAKVVKGHAKIKVACRQRVRCQGKVQIVFTVKNGKHKKQVIIARDSYTVPAGKTVTLSIPLTGKGKKLVKGRSGTLHCTLNLTPTGGKPTRQTLTLKQQQGKH